MKKILIIILILLLLIASFFGYNYLFSEKGIPILETEEEEVIISKYYIYGTHLNLIGSLEITDTNFEEIYLTLYDGEFKDYDINYTNQSNSISFNISDEVNNGIYLDDLPRGNYYAFIKLVYENEEDFFLKDMSGSYVRDKNLSLLISMPNVIITSHQAFFTSEALHKIASDTCQNISEIFNSGECKNELK